MGRFTTSRVFAFEALLFLLAILSAKAQQKAEWTWKDSEGKTHTRLELEEILGQHQQWLESSRKVGGPRLSAISLKLTGANLTGADLRGANLAYMVLVGASLRGANLDRADLSRADLDQANLSVADPANPDLTKTQMIGVNLAGAQLFWADLGDANLTGAKLNGAKLGGANLTGAYFGYADMSDVDFEPQSLPAGMSIITAGNLERLTYASNPGSLIQLRKLFADGGFQLQERKITYALKRREAQQSWEGCRTRRIFDAYGGTVGTRPVLSSPDSILAKCGSFALNRVFFDLTCQYGMSPGRPLILGLALWLLCSLVYFGIGHTSSEKTGLFLICHQSLELEADPSTHKEVIRIQAQKIGQHSLLGRIWEFLLRECSLLLWSMFFSLMSAFNIGFRDINFGRWLRLLTRQEFDIKAVGWARVVAGWQSLISVYFIALWVLTYFGRPFG